MTECLDRFSPSSWQEKGVLKMPPIKTKTPKKTMRSVPSLIPSIVLSLTCVSATMIGSSLVGSVNSHSTQDMDQQTVAMRSTNPEIEVSGDFIAPSSWPDLMKLIEDAPEAIESGGPDPEPLF
jgi:hypothetical protein